MPEIDVHVDDVRVEFEVICDRCGAFLCNSTTVRESRNHRMPQVVVSPCSKCLDNAIDGGYDRGYAAAKKEME